MKFLCPNCKAKYQIADEKVSGRTLKMTCRQCNEEIVIRGDGTRRPGVESLRPSTPATGMAADFHRRMAQAPVAVAPPAGADQWHVAINDIPVGPMRRDEVARKINMGAVGPESLAWREGLDDWLPIKHIPELMALCRAALSTSLPPPPPAMTGALPPFRPADRAAVSPVGGRTASPSTDMFEEAPVAHAPAVSAPPAPPPTRDPSQVSYAGPMPQGYQESSKGTLGWAPMFLLVCGGAFILAVGALLGARVLAPAPQAGGPATMAPVEVPGPITATPVVEEEDSEPIVLDPQEIAGDVEEEKVASSKTTTPKKSTSTSSKTSNLTAEQRALLERMGGASNSDLGGIKVPSSSSSGSASRGGEGLNASQLASVVNKGKRSLQRCYESALRGSGATDTVRLDVEITVSAAGNVTKVSTKGQSLPGMDKCIASTVKTWRFPTSGDSTTTQFPILFQPGA